MVVPAQGMAEVSRGGSRESVEDSDVSLRGNIPDKKRIHLMNTSDVWYSTSVIGDSLRNPELQKLQSHH